MARRWSEPLEWLKKRGRWNDVAPAEIKDLSKTVAKDLVDVLASYPDPRRTKNRAEFANIILGTATHVLDSFDKHQLPGWGRDRFLQWMYLTLLERGVEMSVADWIYKIFDLAIHRNVEQIDEILEKYRIK